MTHDHSAPQKHTHSDTSLFGLWIYILSDCLLFATLFATFAVLRVETASAGGPQELFSIPFVFLETLLLLFSSFTCGLALISLRRSNIAHTIGWFSFTAILGIAFLTLEIREFDQLISEGHSFTGSAFLSAFFTLVGTHGLHVFFGIFWAFILLAQMYRDGVNESVSRRLALFALFWHFLDIVWIFIFSFVYLLPLAS